MPCSLRSQLKFHQTIMFVASMPIVSSYRYTHLYHIYIYIISYHKHIKFHDIHIHVHIQYTHTHTHIHIYTWYIYIHDTYIYMIHTYIYIYIFHWSRDGLQVTYTAWTTCASSCRTCPTPNARARRRCDATRAAGISTSNPWLRRRLSHRRWDFHGIFPVLSTSKRGNL